MYPSLSHALRHLLLALCLLSSSLATAAESPTKAPLPAHFDALVEQVQAQFDIPGLAIAVVKDGQPLLLRGYGQRRLGGQPVTPATRFAIASNTKAFTATALALLVDEGKIAWDRPVIDYLPDFALADPYVTAHLTVRDLLAHNSGLGLGAGDLLWWPQTNYSMEELIRRLRFVPLEKSFRQGYAYDNVLYAVAGALIEKISGRRWEDFIAQRILKPLAMDDARVGRERRYLSGNTAAPHAIIDGELQVIEPYVSEKAFAAGGLQLSARDAAQWMLTQLAQGRIDDENRLYSEDSARQLWSLVTPMPQSPPPCDIAPLATQFSGYALGFQVIDYRGHKLIQHGGGLPGYVSKIVMLPEQNLGIAVFSNQQVRAGLSVLSQVLLDQFLEVDDTDWLAALSACHAQKMAEFHAAKDSSQAARTPNTAALPPEKLIGRYRDAWYGDVDIRATASGALEVDFLPTPALIGELSHWHYNSYLLRWRDAPLPPNDVFLSFNLNAQGEVDGITVTPVSPFTDFSYDFGHLDLRPVATTR